MSGSQRRWKQHMKRREVRAKASRCSSTTRGSIVPLTTVQAYAHQGGGDLHRGGDSKAIEQFNWRRTWVDVEDKKPGGAVAVFWKMAAGRSVRSPFEEFAGEARAEIDSFLEELGEDPTRRSSDRETEINMRRLMAVAACLGDEDFVYLDEMASKGVAIGVDVELPRVPKVFEEKTSWALEFEEAMWEDVVSDNYPSAKENEKDIKRQVMEEVEAGTIKRLGRKEAVKKFGGRLAVAALGAVPKELNSERVRLIHDGTYSVGVNQRIRVKRQTQIPTHRRCCGYPPVRSGRRPRRAGGLSDSAFCMTCQELTSWCQSVRRTGDFWRSNYLVTLVRTSTSTPGALLALEVLHTGGNVSPQPW